MKIFQTSTIAILTALAFSPTNIQAAEADSLVDALSNGDTNINVRYRLESVDQDGIDKNATASTVRTKLNYKTGTYKGFSAFAEFEHSFVLGSTHYNNTINGKTQYPVVADPASTELNQAYITYSNNGLTLKGGRQALNLGNQRYVGTVGWRQNDQTYDAAAAIYSKDKFTAIYGYVWNVNRIFSKDHPLGNLDTKTHAFNLIYAASPMLKVEALGLLVNLDTDIVAADSALSSKTFSLRVSGKKKLDSGSKLGYAVEYANQSDYATKQTDYSADYWAGDVNFASNGFSASLGFEVLGSDNGKGFATPLATLHKFNGFADKFLGTPGGGLKDIYATLAYKVPKGSAMGGTLFKAIYHDFKSDIGSIDYGSELDFVVAKQLNKTVNLTLKAAFYDADMHATDTTKLWAMLTTKF